MVNQSGLPNPKKAISSLDRLSGISNLAIIRRNFSQKMVNQSGFPTPKKAISTLNRLSGIVKSVLRLKEV